MPPKSCKKFFQIELCCWLEIMHIWHVHNDVHMQTTLYSIVQFHSSYNQQNYWMSHTLQIITQQPPPGMPTSMGPKTEGKHMQGLFFNIDAIYTKNMDTMNTCH